MKCHLVLEMRRHLSLDRVKDLDDDLSFAVKAELYCIAYKYFLIENNTSSFIMTFGD